MDDAALVGLADAPVAARSLRDRVERVVDFVEDQRLRPQQVQAGFDQARVTDQEVVPLLDLLLEPAIAFVGGDGIAFQDDRLCIRHVFPDQINQPVLDAEPARLGDEHRTGSPGGQLLLKQVDQRLLFGVDLLPPEVLQRGHEVGDLVAILILVRGAVNDGFRVIAGGGVAQAGVQVCVG